jgi:hypothetical protein
MLEIWRSNDSFCELNSICRIYVAFNTGESIPKFPFVLFGLVYETNTVKYIKTETKFLNHKDQILKTIDEVMELEFVENEESVALKRCLMDVLDRSYQAYSVHLGCYKVFYDQKTKGSTRRSKSKPIIVPTTGSKFLLKIPIPKILYGSPNTQSQSQTCRLSEVMDPTISNKRKLSNDYLIESGKNPTKKRTTVHYNPNSTIAQNNLISSNDLNSSNNTNDQNPSITQKNSNDLNSSKSPNDPNTIAETNFISQNSSVDLNYSDSPNSPNSSIDLNYSDSPNSPKSSIDQNNLFSTYSLNSSNSPIDPKHSLIQEVLNFQELYGVTPHAIDVVNELKSALDKLKSLEDHKIKIDSEIKNMIQIEIPNICKKI